MGQTLRIRVTRDLELPARMFGRPTRCTISAGKELDAQKIDRGIAYVGLAFDEPVEIPLGAWGLAPVDHRAMTTVPDGRAGDAGHRSKVSAECSLCDWRVEDDDPEVVVRAAKAHRAMNRQSAEIGS